MRKRIGIFFLLAALLALFIGIVSSWRQRTIPRNDPAFKRAVELVNDVRTASFPELRDSEINVQPLNSDYIYLEARFTFSSYFFGRRLRYLILFNRDAVTRGVPADGLRAIVAHELAHVDYFQNQSRMGLMGLVQLLSASFTSRFERRADLKAIDLGYGPGLQAYRVWLYRNIPRNRMDEKKRDYFSPEEIGAIMQLTKANRLLMHDLERCVPRNYGEIEAFAANPRMKCLE